MIIENFITCLMRRKSAQYLQFQDEGGIELEDCGREGKKYLLYVHIPFCERLCPYCSFNRYPFEESLARSYFSALREELKIYRQKGYDCTGLYIGGGTPTIMMDELEKTLALIRSLYSIREVSVETNPNHLTQERLEVLKSLGINRLSVGVQSFNDQILRSVDRYEKYGSGQEIQEKLRLASQILADGYKSPLAGSQRAAGAGRKNTLNVDMIFNFPNQTMSMLEEDLDILLSLKIDQITFYPLMVSASTQKALAEKLGQVDYRKEKAFYFKILDKLSAQFQPASAWCFSRADGLIDEYIVDYDEYIGSGSGAFSYLNGCIYANTFDLAEYIRQLKQGRLPLGFKKAFSTREQMRYDFLMKLFGRRLDIEALKAKFNGSLYRYLWRELLFFRLIGGIRTEGGRQILLTPKGHYLWVIMMREFFIGVNNFRDACRRKIAAGS
ncbi:MAG: radical SAM protein [bacterium]|nr:radical SAM protein [bacterium]